MRGRAGWQMYRDGGGNSTEKEEPGREPLFLLRRANLATSARPCEACQNEFTS